MQKLGLDDAAVLELMAVVELFSGFNKLMDGLQVELEQAPPRGHEVGHGPVRADVHHPDQAITFLRLLADAAEEAPARPGTARPCIVEAVEVADIVGQVAGPGLWEAPRRVHRPLVAQAPAPPLPEPGPPVRRPGP